jgi:hypothetical protein
MTTDLTDTERLLFEHSRLWHLQYPKGHPRHLRSAATREEPVSSAAKPALRQMGSHHELKIESSITGGSWWQPLR